MVVAAAAAAANWAAMAAVAVVLKVVRAVAMVAAAVATLRAELRERSRGQGHRRKPSAKEAIDMIDPRVARLA